MILQLDLESHKSLEAVRGFLAGSRDESVLVPGRKAAYAHIGKVLRRFSYWQAKPEQAPASARPISD